MLLVLSPSSFRSHIHLLTSSLRRAQSGLALRALRQPRRPSMPDGLAAGGAPASPVPYRAYVSHRRAQSSLSLSSSAATTPAPSPPPALARAPQAAAAAPAPHAPTARPEKTQSNRAPTSALAAAPLVAPPVPRLGVRRGDALPPPPALRVSSSLRDAAVPPVAAPLARSTDEPPPALRTASSLRAAAPAVAGKGKARASQEQPGAPAAGQAASGTAPPQSARPSVQRSASGRALGTAAVGAPLALTPGPSDTGSSAQTTDSTAGASSSAAHLLPRDEQPARPGHTHSHSHSLSTANAAPAHASHSSHARSLSNTPLPHHISTAARLRGAGGHSGTSSPLPVSPLLSPALAPTLSALQAAQPQLPTLPPGSTAASRQSGFQPRGVSRSRTDEFHAARESKGKGREERGLEGERMQRRLEKVCLTRLCAVLALPSCSRCQRSSSRFTSPMRLLHLKRRARPHSRRGQALGEGYERMKRSGRVSVNARLCVGKKTASGKAVQCARE